MEIGKILVKRAKINKLSYLIFVGLLIVSLLAKNFIDFTYFSKNSNASSVNTQVNMNEYIAMAGTGIYYPWRGKATISGQLPIDKVTSTTVNAYVNNIATPAFSLNVSSLQKAGNVFDFNALLDTTKYEKGYHTLRFYDGTVTSVPGNKEPIVEVLFYIDNGLIGKILSNSNLRLEPNTNDNPITLIPEGSTVEIISEEKGQQGTVSYGTTDIWYKLRYQNSSGTIYEGYVLSALVSITTPGILAMKTTAPGSVLENFDPMQNTYDFHISFNSSFIEFSDIVKANKDDQLTVKINGTVVNPPYKLNLKTGNNVIEIDYTAHSSSLAKSTKYTYNIWRIAESVEAEFQAQLAKFPESYKEGLRTLHSKFPNWIFVADNIDYTWEYVISNQDVGTTSLIWHSRPNEYIKSNEIKDGTSFVTASRAAVEYYMDPRNFLNEERIFQFEDLKYNSNYHNLEGVTKILSGSGLAGKEQLFINAAKDSNVSPYHLASRSRLEVSVGSGLSVIATGNYKGQDNKFLGIYNFYNLGTGSSTDTTLLIERGLNFALGYSSGYLRNQADLNYYNMPWNTEQRAITGGAKYIGRWYINADAPQNTIYYQKFNPNRPGVHQYMQNIEAPYHEATSVYRAYTNMNAINSNITFKIPVYKSMPELKIPRPDDSNKLSSLGVNGQTLSPAFDPAKSGPYELAVSFDTSSITINAATLNSKASITGTGAKSLKEGVNTFTVSVTPQSGEKRDYTIKITRKPPQASSENRLESLTLSNGTLIPSFNKDNNGIYKVDVAANISEITIAAKSLSPLATISGDGPKELRYGINDYSITVSAEDKSKRIYRIQITRKYPDFKPNDYIIGEGILRGVDTSTNVQTLKGNIASSSLVVKALDTQGKELANSDIIGTGTKFMVYVDGDKINEFTTIIAGDISGDGKINSIDITLIRAHILRINTLTGDSLAAADINKDGKVNSIDITLVRAHILRMSQIDQKK